MHIAKGEIYGFLGPNGAGKTTVMKMITNQWKPTSGYIILFGEKLRPDSYSFLKRMGSMIEYPVFYNELTAEENLKLHCEYMGYYSPDSVEKALSLLSLSDNRGKKVKEFSLGMKQRLGIARAVLTKPEFLVLDEPTNYYVYCLWVSGSCKGKGYGRALMEYCVTDARENGKSGICMLGSNKQKAWLSDQSFAKKFGFEVVDTTEQGYELLALSFDGTSPGFAQSVKNKGIEMEELTIYYDMQCPYIYQNLKTVKKYCDMNEIPVSVIPVDTLQKAKELPCVFNNWGVFYKGKFQTVNLLDAASLERILKKSN
ncbi:GNAT family N-acetyltransferase [Lacrimispora defluvii]|nr:GNAT family N-acetyltransferase [Lacrimispora defluvii]